MERVFFVGVIRVLFLHLLLELDLVLHRFGHRHFVRLVIDGLFGVKGMNEVEHFGFLLGV